MRDPDIGTRVAWRRDRRLVDQRWVAVVVVAVLGLIAASCTPSATAAELARDQWEAVDAQDFVLDYDASCSAGPCEEFEGHYEVVYRSGASVDAAVRLSTSTRTRQLGIRERKLLPTVDELLSNAGDEESVAFDIETGLPTRVTRGSSVFDGIGVVFDVADAATNLDAARSAWAGALIPDYRLTYGRSCFCIDNGEITIDVRAGLGIPVAWPGSDSGQALAGGVPMSVEDLFALIDRTLTIPADAFTIAYEATGVPIEIRVDPSSSTIDDEFSYAQISVTPLP